MSFHAILAVAAGGALGAVARFLVSSGTGYLFGYGFPFGTLIVNVLGSFALGVLIQVTAFAWSPSAEVRAFVVVGVLGAFTTFSTFSLDVLIFICLQLDNHIPRTIGNFAPMQNTSVHLPFGKIFIFKSPHSLLVLYLELYLELTSHAMFNVSFSDQEGNYAKFEENVQGCT